MVLEGETWQQLEIFSKEIKRKGKFPFLTSEIIGNGAFPLSFHGENSHEILMFFAVFSRIFLASLALLSRVPSMCTHATCLLERFLHFPIYPALQ